MQIADCFLDRSLMNFIAQSCWCADACLFTIDSLRIDSLWPDVLAPVIVASQDVHGTRRLNILWSDCYSPAPNIARLEKIKNQRITVQSTSNRQGQQFASQRAQCQKGQAQALSPTSTFASPREAKPTNSARGNTDAVRRAGVLSAVSPPREDFS